jgi:hypothetical protein
MMLNSEEEAAHGHWMEYSHNVIEILANIAFVIGCYCFFSSNNSVYGFGDWAFIIACTVNTIVVLSEFIEAMHNKSVMKPKDRDEIMEHLCFLCANALFAIGCVFFLPSVKYLTSFYYTASAIGAWCCILASFGLVYGTFYNAICFEGDLVDSTLDPRTHEYCRKLTKISISLTLIGSMLFVVGSFMYRPIFGGLCPPHSTNAVCEAVSTYGTKCYLFGSYIFLAASIVGILTTDAKVRGSNGGMPTEKTKLISDMAKTDTV